MALESASDSAVARPVEDKAGVPFGCSRTGHTFPSGKETGQGVSHYVMQDGHSPVFAKLESKGFKLRWQARVAEYGPARRK